MVSVGWELIDRDDATVSGREGGAGSLRPRRGGREREWGGGARGSMLLAMVGGGRRGGEGSVVHALDQLLPFALRHVRRSFSLLGPVECFASFGAESATDAVKGKDSVAILPSRLYGWGGCCDRFIPGCH